MRARITISEPGGYVRHLELDGPAGTTLDALRSHALGSTATWLEQLHDDSGPLPGVEQLGGGRLVDGAHLTTDGGPPRAPRATLRLRVISGPDIGMELDPPQGVLSVGRATDCTLRCNDPAMSRVHCEIRCGPAGMHVRDRSSTHGTFLDGVRVTGGWTPWAPSVYLRAGSTVLALSGSGGTAVPVEDITAEIEWPTRTGTARALVPAGWIAPVISAAVLCVVTRSPAYALLGLAAPLTWAVTRTSSTVRARLSRSAGVPGLRARRRAARAAIAVALAAERNRRRSAHADPVERRSQIFAGRPDDTANPTRVRVGLGESPASVQVNRAGQCTSAGLLHDVPILLDVLGGVSISGARPAAVATTRWIVAQLAGRLGPDRLRIHALLAPSTQADWAWLSWLPQFEDVAVGADAIDTAIGSLAGRTRPAGDGDRHDVVVLDCSPHVIDLSRLGTACPVVVGHGWAGSPPPVSVRFDPDDGARASARDADGHVVAAIADGLTISAADQFARATRAVAARHGTSSVPATARLADVLGIAGMPGEWITQHWRRPTTSVPIGLASEGSVTIDLVIDGPHLLIAGTTGSGKSQLLQSLLVSLAVHNATEDVTFLLVDFKGGAAFTRLAALPHSVGVVTDLDPAASSRALQSLRAELRRREQALARAGAADLDQYRKARRPDDEHLPRLMVVIDEFATLSDELPDFIPGLIAIARRGRSLGIHLVLATQRPSGCVTPELRANVGTRIALRVTDPAESIDVIGSSDAATITPRQPGRGFLLRDGMLTEFQAASVTSPDAAPIGSPTVTELDEWGRRRPTDTQPPRASDIDAFVAAITTAAAGRDAPRPRRPWLPPLPAVLSSTEIAPVPAPAIAIGLVDLPAEQRRVPHQLDLSTGGATLIIGGPGSGRTTALETVLVAAEAARAHVHAIDCDGDLTRRVRWCASTAAESDLLSVRVLIEHLLARPPRDAAADTAPPEVLVVDGWHSLRATSEAADRGAAAALLDRLIGRAHRVGVTVVLTADRTALTARYAAEIHRRMLLRLADPADYTLAGLRDLPLPLPPGRAIREDGAHVQLALPRSRAAEIPPLSTQPVLRALPRQVRRTGPNLGAGRCVMGMSSPHGEPVVLDVAAGDGRWLIHGPPGSGRSTALRALAVQLLEQHARVGVFAPDSSPLSSLRCPVAHADYLIVDDPDLLDDDDRTQALSRWHDRSDASPRAVMIAARTGFSSLGGADARSLGARSGLLLQPSTMDFELLGARPVPVIDEPLPGRGWLVATPAQLGSPTSGPVRVQVADG